LDLDDISLVPVSEDEALRLAMEAERGTLDLTGERGDCVEVQFDAVHALVLYMGTDRKILRPHLPNRKETGQGIEEFFCECCGVQLGDRAEMLTRCTSREEGFRLCREILRGRLPDAIPVSSPDQSFLPGMNELAHAEAAGRVVQWVLLQGRRKSSH
jgi:hypothetical protein